jgi:glycosyltransferase involved in cell wall biosynthesis
MKTILIAHNFSEISFASMSFHLAHHLADLGNRVVFISHKPYFAEVQNIKKGIGEIIICSWPTEKRPTSINDYVWFSKIYLKYRPDIVIGHFVGSNISILVSKVLSLYKTKTFCYYHTLSDQILTDQNNISIKQNLLFLRKKIFYKLFCDVVVCPSAMAKKDLEIFFTVSKGIVLLNPMEDRFEVKKGISNEKIVISYLGRLDCSKGVVDLIKAFEIYKNGSIDSKMILNIAGRGSQELEIKEFIKNNDSIHYYGSLGYDKIDEYLNKSHFTIIPSKFDNLPTVGLESMMNNTPLLISNKTGLTSYLKDDFECFKFDSNIDSIVLLLKKVEKNMDKQEQMGINARNTFLSIFSIENYCNDFSKIVS